MLYIAARMNAGCAVYSHLSAVFSVVSVLLRK
jgi:hypothetical protein